MTGWIASVLCALAAGATAAPAFAQERPIVVGATAMLSGEKDRPGAEYGRGLFLWQEEVNAAGGLLGRRVELRLLDDGGEATRAGMLYGSLIREHKADLLIGPYGSAATLLAAAEAERARRV